MPSKLDSSSLAFNAFIAKDILGWKFHSDDWKHLVMIPGRNPQAFVPLPDFRNGEEIDQLIKQMNDEGFEGPVFIKDGPEHFQAYFIKDDQEYWSGLYTRKPLAILYAAALAKGFRDMEAKWGKV